MRSLLIGGAQGTAHPRRFPSILIFLLLGGVAFNTHSALSLLQ
jgi:hypothetical protein